MRKDNNFIFAFVITFAFAILCYALVMAFITKDTILITMIVTAALSVLTTVINFRYGSSQGSKDKSEYISQSQQKPPPIVDKEYNPLK